MDAFYINLDRENARRESLEARFREFAIAPWRLARVPAIDARTAALPAGSIRPAEKACLLSHRKAIEASLAVEGAALILEDDALVGPALFRLLGQLQGALADPSLHVLYTDLCMPDPHAMIDQFLMHRELMKRRELSMIDLRKRMYSGATAYFVLPAAKRTLLELIDALPSLDVPYDILLRHWTHQGRLNAACVFPFLTTVAPGADRSQLAASAGADEDPSWNVLRRLLWIDSDSYPGDPLAELERVEARHADESTRRFLRVMAVVLAPGYQTK